MTFRVTSVTRCPGQGHWHLDIEILSPALGPRRLTLTTPEVTENIQDYEEARERVIVRCRSRVREAGAGTFAQVRTALEGQEFQV